MKTHVIRRPASRTRHTIMAFMGCILMVVGVLPALAQSRGDRPNVVIILADDLGYGDVSVNNPRGRIHTPHIDNLAKTGIRFTDAHAGGAVCTPSRYGLLTGRYYFRVPKQRVHWGYLPPTIEKSRETIGTLLQRAGYTTACVGKWHVGLNWQVKDKSQPQITPSATSKYTNTDFSAAVTGGPNSLGFNYSFILPGSLDMAPYVFLEDEKVVDANIKLAGDLHPDARDKSTYAWDTLHVGEGDIYHGRGQWWRNGEMSASFSVEKCFDQIVDRGISFITDQVRNNAGKPFMLYLPLTGPHTPWVPNDSFKGVSQLGSYGDFVSQVDNVVFKITETLKTLGIEDNTLLIFTSDNGAHWSEEDIQTYGHQSNWGRRGQKGDIWDGGHHIPLFVKWPSRIKGPGEYHGIVSLVDVMATLAEITGQNLDKKSAEDSFSFYKILKGNLNENVRDHIVYISSLGELAIQKKQWKFTSCLGSCGFTKPSFPRYVKNGPEGQLYNLEQDPFERTNLFLEEPQKVQELSDLLQSVKERGSSR